MDPVPWTDYFSQELYLPHITPTARTVFHVYLTPPTNKGPLFVMHHGAGSSGLSFAVCASEIKKAVPNAGILSVDARGHGETVYQRLKPGTLDPLGEEAGGVLDLSLETLSQDLVAMVQLTKAKMGWEELPGMILVGHSLGGAVVVDAAKQGNLGNMVLGYAVLDVVEGGSTVCPLPTKTNCIAHLRLKGNQTVCFKLDPNSTHQVRQSTPYKACKPTSPPAQRPSLP